MNWLKNIENIAKNNTPGVCTHCGSVKTDYSAIEVSGGYGYAIIWCNECKHAFNLSRIKITDETNKNKKIPNDLIF